MSGASNAGARSPSRDGAWRLYLGIFFLFAPIGALLSLVQESPWGWSATLMTSLFGGVISLGWAYAFARRRWWLLVPLNIVPFVAGPLYFRPLSQLGLLAYGQDLPELSRRIAAAVGALASVSIGFVFVMIHMSRSEKKAERLRTEMALAERIHRSLVPAIEYRGAAAEVYGRSEASTEMGGDLIDIAERDGATSVYVADVSGHGVRAGVLMAMVKSSIRTLLLSEESARTPLGELTRQLNRLVSQVAERDMFATFACARVCADRSVEFVLAGHLPILLVSASGQVRELENESLPLGVDADETFASRTVRAEPGDVVVILTDGLVEAADSSGRQFGMAGVRAALSRLAGTPLSEMYSGVLEAVRSHGAQNDDQTLLLARIV